MIDLHGVLDQDVFFYQNFLSLFIQNGHEIFICSGPTYKKIYDEITVLGYIQNQHYTKILSVTDFLIEKNVDHYFDSIGNFWTADPIWWSSKGEIAKIFNIDLMIDDTEKYGINVPQTTKFFQVRKGDPINV